jgi:tetratricopeptide (TPR) repeat protein
LRLTLIAAALAFVAGPAGAAWHKASTPHFVIYADEKPDDLRAYAEKLERFDKAVRVARGMKDPPFGDGNRLTVYIVPDALSVARLKRGADPAVAGFYRVNATGSYAFIPRRISKDLLITPDVVFFHEYAHHLMFQDLSTPMPPWLTEGFAEFMGTAEVGKDGSVGLGVAPTHRAWALKGKVRNPFPFTQMLAAEPARTNEERSALYARGWLLSHYLTFAPKRKGQLEAYLAAMAAGQAPGEAARATFGDLQALERETIDYLRADKFPYLTIPAMALPIGKVEIAPLSPGLAAMLPLALRMHSGSEAPADYLGDIRAAAAAYPGDAAVQVLLSEAETRNKQYRAAEASADRALAANPALIAAMIQKGRALAGRAEAREAGVTFANARDWFMKANRADPEDPEPLLLYYQTYAAERVRPTANAIAALHYASDLAPQDMGLRLQSARLHAAAGNKAEARKRAILVAFNPHNVALAEQARRFVEQLDTGRPILEIAPLRR